MFVIQPHFLLLLVITVAFGGTLTLAQTGSALSGYNGALKQRAAGNTAAAIDELKRTIEEYPFHARSYARLISLSDPSESRLFFETLPKAYCDYGVGLLQRRDGQNNEAELKFRSSIELAPGFLPAYKELADTCRERQKLPELEAELRRNQNGGGDAAAAHQFGLAYVVFLQGSYEKAIEHSLLSSQANGEFLEPYYVRFLAYRESGQTDEALAVAEILLEKAQRDDDLEWIERVSGFIGLIHADSGNAYKAQSFFQRSLAVAREIGDRAGEQAYLAHAGAVQSNLGSHHQALASFEEALRISRELGDKLSEGRNIGLVGDAQAELGHYAKAIESYSQAVRVAREIADRRSEAHQISSLGSIYATVGDVARARQTIGIALNIARELKDRWLETRFLQILGYTNEKAGLHSEALKSYADALAVAREVGDRHGEAAKLADLARAQANSGDTTNSLRSYEEALRIARETNAIAIEGAALNDLGQLLFRRGQFKAAEQSHRKAITIGLQTRIPGILWQANAGIARALQAQGQVSEAIDHYKRAIETIEEIRGRIEVADEKSGFLEDKVEVFRGLIALLGEEALRQSNAANTAATFHYIERARARAFLDLLAESRVRAEGTLPVELLRRQQDLQSRISRIQSELMRKLAAKVPRAEIVVLEQELERIDAAHRDLKRDVRRNNSAYAELRYPEPISLEQLQSSLGEQEVLLQYSVAISGSFLIAVTRESTSVTRLPAADQIGIRVKRLREALIRPDRRAISTYISNARWLYDELIRPVERLVSGKRNLIIAADGPLHYLPFEVLLRPEKNESQADMSRLPYLVRDHAFSYVASASVLLGLSKRSNAKPKPRRKFIAFADPSYPGNEASSEDNSEPPYRRGLFEDDGLLTLKPLKQSRDEVEAIARLYPETSVELFLGNDANEENVKSTNLSDYRVIHFAVHGLLNEEKPQFSGLVLTLPRTTASEDGLLQVYEIFNLSLNADLVVLSACETGLGKQDRGEGLIGLTRAFLYAGTPSVVVSLWKVQDNSTAELMIRFYKHLDKSDKAEALRQSQLELIGGSKFSHPYYWAPFILVGEA